MAKVDGGVRANNNHNLPAVPASPPLAACVFVMDAEGQVLAVTLEEGPDLEGHADPAKHPDMFTWGLPGGGVERNESPAVAAVRECFEETGYVVADLFPVHVAINDRHLSHCFVARVVAAEAGAPRPAPGEGVAAWVDPACLLGGPYAQFNRAVQAKVLGDAC